MRILVAEDKPATAALLQCALEGEGHHVTVAYDGTQTLALARTSGLHLILLDIMLPVLDGFTVLRQLREAGRRTPVIILTARDAKSDVIRGLDEGADDYLTKPFELDLLLARVRAVTRRSPIPDGPELRFLDLRLDSNNYELHRGDRTESLTRIEYALLETLIRRPGTVTRRETLIENGWGPGAADPASLYVFIRSLRAKITHPGETELLHTVRGVGYSLRPGDTS